MESNWVCPDYSDSWLGVNWVWFGFKGNWALIAKTEMKSDAVIEGFDVIEDSRASDEQFDTSLVKDDLRLGTSQILIPIAMINGVAFHATILAAPRWLKFPHSKRVRHQCYRRDFGAK